MADPEHELPNVEYAGFWKRVAAYLVDGFILAIVMYPIGIALKIPMETGFNAGPQSPEEAIFSLFGVALTWLYFSIMESSSKQATLGKMLLRIYISDKNGKKVSFARATGRHFGKIISGIILGIGYLMAGWTKRKQALHDIMAKTLVLRQ